MRRLILLLTFFPILLLAQNSRQVLNFNLGWQFKNQEDLSLVNFYPNQEAYTFESWETVNLPHTAKIEPLVVVSPWEGISWYKKDFSANTEWRNKRISIAFEAVMQKAEIWFNGKFVKSHSGGYLPFSVDISSLIIYDKPNRLVVKTDNHDHPEIPPGKPIKELDFCYFSGIYRNVNMVITNNLHITDAVAENKVASGGLRVWYPEITQKSATIAVSTHIKNENKELANVQVLIKLKDKNGQIVSHTISNIKSLDSQLDTTIIQQFKVDNPLLWHPVHPNLYKLVVELKSGNKIIDVQQITIGIRGFELKDDKLVINGKPFLLVGTNRHQEYPYIGNALSDNAQYRDALKIKNAGFNIVRLSHYPQANAFMDACDELGLLTIAAIPGWQFVGNEAFIASSYQDARELIRRDRNHASVVFWELSLNESPMKNDFMQQMNVIAKEESPESKLITCGWINKFYDVWIPARQHAKFPDYWKKYKGKTPLFTGEYGDWEYFAQDAGLNQAGYAGLKSDERTSRQLRGDGEKRLLQQAANFQEAHNDNKRNPHLGDANWLMFDYNRGYSPDIESSGIMDIFRLPKFANYFYSSQTELPMLKIASNWNEKSNFENLTIYSNCDEIALFLNNKLIERKGVEKLKNSDMLLHPPFVFKLKKYEAGVLKAIGYKNGKAILQDIVQSAGEPTQLKLTYDRSNKSLKADGSDVVFVYAAVCDEAGNTVTDATLPISFSIDKGGKLIGENPIKSEAGIASILLQSKALKSGKIRITANALGLKNAVYHIKLNK